MNQIKISFLLLVFFLILNLCISIDSISPTRSLKDGDLIVSRGETFALGFFSPGNSARRYVGIWYNKISEQTVVWVANRNNPINGTSGILAIDSRGNLVLYGNNETSIPLWSAKLDDNISTSVQARLLDSGNLIMVDQKDNNRILWQSFNYPTDTMLPYMKLGMDKINGENWLLSSWKSPDDPRTGTVYLKIDPVGFPQLLFFKGPNLLWRAGSWTGRRWSGIPEMAMRYFFSYSFVNNNVELSYFYCVDNASILYRVVTNESGLLYGFLWNSLEQRWKKFWRPANEPCDNYGECGPNSNCDPYHSNDFICKCLPGFKPKSPRDWYLRDGSGGCIRKTGLSTCRSGEGFVKLATVRVPDTRVARANMSMNLNTCEQECLKNCSCMAYTSADERGFGCLTWFGDLVDTRKCTTIGQDLYVRVDAAELAANTTQSNVFLRKSAKILMVPVASVWLTIIFFAYLWIKRRKNRAVKSKQWKRLFDPASGSIYYKNTLLASELEPGSHPQDVTFFDLSTIVAATDDFSPTNKLGQGGFGIVYKGQLPNGKEVAVKRLSANSGQGIEELKNEVMLIAKLQHRNLVKLLGCCVEGGEQMLIYEYLPNKSLDSFLFDKTKKAVLDWKKRFDIIIGIARGILYLHQDSRLTIIHRDLKCSNILLDANMNSKISDFGMARIFRTDQIQEKTTKVVGTYGYMPLEYALLGNFSTKSDVFSFGMILLEIVSGIKNNGFRKDDPSLSLIEHVWELWRQNRGLEIIDSSLEESYPKDEALRCIQIGILCAQENAQERPTMVEVVLMLGSEKALPSPKQPAFVFRKPNHNSNSVRADERESYSINEVTITGLRSR